ncbi:MAG: RibD family protein [Candidatus Dormibacteraceae bacterium]
MSVDGYIDDATPGGLLLSSQMDLDRVDGERASCDAILIGANTIRQDNPRLVVRSKARRAERLSRGQPATPIKVTITNSGNLDPASDFFSPGEVRKLIYCPRRAEDALRKRLGTTACIIAKGDTVTPLMMLNDLADRGIERLLVEGGRDIHTQFLTAGLIDELQLVIAPLFVGDSHAPRFVDDGIFPHHAGHRMRLSEARSIGDVVLLRYLLKSPVGGG